MATVLIASAVLLAALVAWWTGWQTDQSDFWGMAQLVAQTGHDPGGLYNGFYPVGYLAFLRVLSWASIEPAVPATMLSVLSYGGILAATWRIAADRLPLWWALVVVAATAAFPDLFRYGTAPGADLPAVALGVWGAVWLLRARAVEAQVPLSVALGAGMLLGVAAIVRYHMLAWAAAVYLALALVRPRRIHPAALAATLVLYGIQSIVALAAGHGPFHTAQAWNVYKMVHGVTWTETARIAVPPSITAVIVEAPRTFAEQYLGGLTRVWWVLAVPIFYSWVTRSRPAAPLARALVVLVAGYLAAIALGGSARGTLPVIPFVMLGAAGAMCELYAAVMSPRRPAGTTRVAVCILVALAGLVLVMCARSDWGIVKRRHHLHAAYAAAEAALVADGVQSAREVFATDLNLYFPQLRRHVPRRNGTWLRVGNSQYARAVPDLCVSSLDCFVTDARRMAVTHVVTADEDANRPSFLAGLGTVVPGGDGIRVWRVP